MDQISLFESLVYCSGAVIAKQLYQRYLNGATKDVRTEQFGASSKALSQAACEIARAI